MSAEQAPRREPVRMADSEQPVDVTNGTHAPPQSARVRRPRTMWDRLAGPSIDTDGRHAWVTADDADDRYIACRFIETGEAKALLRSISDRRGLAAALDVSAPALDHWLNERRRPPFHQQIRLGRVLRQLSQQRDEREARR